MIIDTLITKTLQSISSEFERERVVPVCNAHLIEKKLLVYLGKQSMWISLADPEYIYIYTPPPPP